MQHAPIVNNTVLQFDPWRLLGIPHGANLPDGFNNPVQFNLFNAVDPIIQRERANIELERDIRAQADAAAAAAADDDGDGGSGGAAAADGGGGGGDDDDAGPPRRRQRHH
ncbi:hypothetical protein PF006_g31728 [Phytophthora fragariae]|uniref:Uncharacterized protein n=1 Tax=Phytophthora fragariae TaxID=53985 RepID=A0A6A3PVD8_9STRA|nr:hypothetical protein PF006_g31728 [Phytophthora fragariae]